LIAEVAQVVLDGNKCLDPDAMTTPGEWCKYCPAAGECGALSTELYAVYTMLQGKANRNITPEELSAELVFLELLDDMLKGRKTAIHAVANARMDTGENVPGWTRESKLGNRRWKVSPETVESVTGFDATAGKMVTPAELERRGADYKSLKYLTEQPKTKAKLVQVTAEDFKRQFEGG